VVSLLTEDGRIREKVGFEKGELALWKRCKEQKLDLFAGMRHVRIIRK
jgi:hypothetical protein